MDMNAAVILFILSFVSLFVVGQSQDDSCDCGDEDTIVLKNLQDYKEFSFPATGGQDYPNNCDCEWRIGSGYHVNIEFDSFETQEGYDFVDIYELEDQDNYRERCSGSSCSSFTSKGPGLRLHFTSDATITRRGFTAKVVSVEGGSWFQGFHIAIILFAVILALSVVFGIFIMYRRRQAWIKYIKERKRTTNPPQRSVVVPARRARSNSSQSHHRSNAVYSLPSVAVGVEQKMVDPNPSPTSAYLSSIEQGLWRPRGASLLSTSSCKVNVLPTIIENQEMKWGSY
uniref:CUB domain-containing protein n=1 Tax=Plectus sambesii TaxID=2011161 RepID=A0A914VQE1_9BILA